MKKTAINIHLQVFEWMCVFIFLGYIPRDQVSESHVGMFNCTRSCLTDFQSGYCSTKWLLSLCIVFLFFKAILVGM